jgi:hypothetical protein
LEAHLASLGEMASSPPLLRLLSPLQGPLSAQLLPLPPPSLPDQDGTLPLTEDSGRILSEDPATASTDMRQGESGGTVPGGTIPPGPAPAVIELGRVQEALPEGRFEKEIAGASLGNPSNEQYGSVVVPERLGHKGAVHAHGGADVPAARGRTAGGDAAGGAWEELDRWRLLVGGASQLKQVLILLPCSS